MPLQTSGPISLLDIQNEFGGSNPIGLDEYYGAASGLPTSGTISLNQFYGLSAGWFLTVAQNPFNANVFGYFQGSYGSLTNTDLNGAAIQQITYVRTPLKNGFLRAITVVLIGVLPQTHFSTIQSPQGLQQLSTANALFNANASQNSSAWSWFIQNDPTAFWQNAGSQIEIVFT